jgi:agmatine deiminase
MPAETALHERTLMAWPTQTRAAALWHDVFDEARRVHATVARAIARFEPVTMVAHPDDADGARTACGDEVDVVALAIDDSWLRDSGPVIVRTPGGARHAVQFRFNAWGEKYQPYDADATIGTRLAARLDLPVHDAPIVLEGGAIAVDGAGTLVTTERCLLHPNRNPGWSRAQLEEELRIWLGGERVVWLADGIAEDDETDGHVDNVFAFFAPGRGVHQGCRDAANPNHAIAVENRRRLAAAGIDVVELPELPYADVGGRCVPVPPCNFYAVNGGLVVPVAGGASDRDALDTLAACFGDRDVVPVPGAVLAYGGGGVHCITQQVPA